MRAAKVSLVGMREGWSYEPPDPTDERSTATTENVRAFLAAHGVTLRYRRTWLLERLLAPLTTPVARGARYREVVLREGDFVAVLGSVTERINPTAHSGGLRQPALQPVFGEIAGTLVSNQYGAW